MAGRATKGDENSPRPRAATVKERSPANFDGLRSLTFAAQGVAATAFSTERSAAGFAGLRSLTVAALMCYLVRHRVDYEVYADPNS